MITKKIQKDGYFLYPSGPRDEGIEEKVNKANEKIKMRVKN